MSCIFTESIFILIFIIIKPFTDPLSPMWQSLPNFSFFTLIWPLSIFSVVFLKLWGIYVVTEKSITKFFDFFPAVEITDNGKSIVVTWLLSSEMSLVVFSSLWCTTLLSDTYCWSCSLCTPTATSLPLPSPRNSAGSYSKYSQLFIAAGYRWDVV